MFAFNVLLNVTVSDHLDVADCGDIPMVQVDNKVSLRQLEDGARELIGRESAHFYHGHSLAKDSQFHPRILTLVCIYPIESLFIWTYVVSIGW